MPVLAERIARDIAAIAALTDTPGAGASRPTFSAAWRAARDYVEGELRAAGCDCRIDAAGNLHARPRSLVWEAPAWLSGSHLDSVPNGGDYDGVAGAVAPLEALRVAHETGDVALPLELIIFAEEEGTTFGLGMLGSKAWSGQLSAEVLRQWTNADGRSYIEAGLAHGVRPHDMERERIRPESITGFLEVHIEQGPGMWKRGEALAIVTAIAGRRQYLCVLTGAANHAGSTSMRDRRDALAGAAEIIAALERTAGELSPQAVITVGRIRCEPNAINVIPQRVEFTIDFRSPQAAQLDAGDTRIRALLAETARRRGLAAELTCTEQQPAIALDARVCDRLQAASTALGLGVLPRTVSGALHDAAILAPLVPTAMMFVPSRDGISHNPAEFSRVEDIAQAARVLAECVRRGPL